MLKATLYTWKDASHEGDDEGKQWCAQVNEDVGEDEDSEVLYMTGWWLTEQEAIEDCKSWLHTNYTRFVLS